MKNLNKTTDILNNELEPTMNELKQVLTNVNKIADSADAQVTNVKNAMGKVFNIAGAAANGIKSISGGFFKGLLTAVKLFSKK